MIHPDLKSTVAVVAFACKYFDVVKYLLEPESKFDVKKFRGTLLELTALSGNEET